MNFMKATLERDGAGLVCLIGDQRLTVPHWTAASRPELERYVRRDARRRIRSEHVQDAAVESGAPEGQRLRGEVVTTELLGSDLLGVRHVEIEADPVVTAEVIEVAADIDEAAAADLAEEAAPPADSGRRPVRHSLEGSGRRRGRDGGQHRAPPLLRSRGRARDSERLGRRRTKRLLLPWKPR